MFWCFFLKKYHCRPTGYLVEGKNVLACVVLNRLVAGQHYASQRAAAFTLLRQLCILIPNHLVAQLARDHAVEEKSRTFRSWSHVLSLIYAHLTHALGLNEVLRRLAAALRPLVGDSRGGPPRPARTPSPTPTGRVIPRCPKPCSGRCSIISNNSTQASERGGVRSSRFNSND